MTELPIAVTDLRESGLRLIRFGTSEFSSLAKTSLPASAVVPLTPLLPFSVFLKNESAQTIIGYTVSWTSNDASGTTYTDYRTVFDAITLKGLVAPNAARLVTILTSDPPPSSFVQDIAEESDRLKNQASVSIALEAVMFDDGSVQGRDTSQSIEQMRARVRAEYDLYVRIARLSESDAAVIPDLQLVSASVKPGSKLVFGSNPYSEWYRFYAATSASSLLQLAKVKGVPELLSYVRTTLVTKKYQSFVNTKKN